MTLTLRRNGAGGACGLSPDRGGKSGYNRGMIALLLALLIAPVVTDFPGGSAGRVEWLSESHVRVNVEGQADQDGRNRQANWYYFRVDSYPKREIRIDLADLVGEYNYRYGSHAVNESTHPVYSYDGIRWTHFPSVEWDAKNIQLSFRFTPERSPFWIAHTPPYTEKELGRLESAVGGNPMLHRESVGKTLEGRDMPLWTITDPAVPQVRKKTIWLMFRQHAWESGSSWVCDGAVRALLADNEEAAQLRRSVTWKIFPMADPDGVFHGGVRFNRKGYDLNRNWDAIDAAKMPEIAAQHAAIEQWLAKGNEIDAFLALHNTETGEYLEGPAKHRPLVQKLQRILKKESTFNPTRKEWQDASPSTAPDQKGRMTVNQGLFADFGICAMLMEQMVARNEKLGGLPTIAQRQQFGGELVRAMAKALE